MKPYGMKFVGYGDQTKWGRSQARAATQEEIGDAMAYEMPACEVCTHSSHGECYVAALERGAAVAFGLMGMAEAIRARACCPTCGAGPDGPCYNCVRIVKPMGCAARSGLR